MTNRLLFAVVIAVAGCADEPSSEQTIEAPAELTARPRRDIHSMADWRRVRGQEAVIVRHPDRTSGIYKADEWSGGDGVIVLRMLPSGQLVWHDPAGRPPIPVLGHAPDGTITVNGEPGSPVLQRMFPPLPQ
jgi:hypothetical protein